jgi:Yip1 domain
MEQRGLGLSTSAPPRPGGAARTDRIRSSSDLGATLRSVLLSPQRGFRGAMRAAVRRERSGRRPAEGVAPSVLAAVGGAGGMLLWLKLGSALGLRNVTGPDFRWSYLVIAVAVGAVLGLLGQTVWSLIAPGVARALGGVASASDARLVWGGSSLPQVFALVLLLPLDLAIAGPASFTDARFADSLSAAWASLSIAMAVALVVWSVYLFIRGMHVVTGMSTGRICVMAVVAAVCLAAVTTGVLVAALAVGRS